jgi:hypothetical protein
MDDQSERPGGVTDARSLVQIENYVSRGRKLADRDDAYLRHAWIGAMKICSTTLADFEDHELREDLQSEMLLRGYQPPFEFVKDEIRTPPPRSEPRPAAKVAKPKPPSEESVAKNLRPAVKAKNIGRDIDELRDSFERKPKN